MWPDNLGHAKAASKTFANIGLVDQAKLGAARIRNGNQDTPCGRAADKAAGSVDRVQHPGQPARAGGGAVFFAQNSVVGAQFSQHRAHGAFGAPVGFGHGIKAAISILVVTDQGGLAEMAQGLRAGHIGHCMGRTDQLCLQVTTVNGHLAPDATPTGASAGRVARSSVH